MSTMNHVRQILRLGDASKDAVGHRLKLLRERGWRLSQREMAERMGTTTNNYQHMEKGKTFPQAYHVQALLDAYGVDHNFIFAGDPSRLPTDIFSIFAELPMDDATG